MAHTWTVTWPDAYYNAEDDVWFDAVFRFHRFDFSQVDIYPLPNFADLDAIWASVDARMPDLSHLKGWYASRDQQAHMGVEFD